MKKTFGKNTLGSGGKMEFHTKEFGRSTHNLSETFRSTTSAGTIIPFYKKLMLPGDTFDLKLECDVRTLPTVGPLFGSYKIQLDVFSIPLRLYMRDLQMNKLEIGKDMSVVKFPLIRIQGNDPTVGLNYEYSVDTPWGGKEISNCQIEPSTILSYLGIKGLGWRSQTPPAHIVSRDFNAVPWLMYWDIFKQYYANKMEDKAYYIHNDLRTQNELIQSIELYTNNGSSTIPVNVEQTKNISVQMYFELSFANYKNYNMFLEDEFCVKLSRTIAGETSEVIYKGNTDVWKVERVDSLNKVYLTYTGDQIGNTVVQYKVTAYSAVKYDYVRPNLKEFDLKNIDVMRDIIMNKNGLDALIIDEELDYIEPYSSLLDGKLATGSPIPLYEITNLQCKQEGLAVKTYQSDVNNNFLNTEWIDGENGVNAVTAIQTDENGKFTLDEFNIKKKVYNMLNHIEAAGGTYDDWQDVQWGIQRNRQIASPVYEGGLSKELVFEEVISNSASNEQGEQPLGTLAGRGVVNGKHKGGYIVVKATEPSYLMCMFSLTPRIDYSTGNDWDNNLKDMGELHSPYLDGIGYQDLITDTMAWWDTRLDNNGVPTFKSAGKQPAWINYQTSVNKVYGNFALENEQLFMVLNRRYEVDWDGVNYEIGDLTTYIDPSKFNHIFADASPDAQNFWVQIGIECEARRVMSATEIPNL